MKKILKFILFLVVIYLVVGGYQLYKEYHPTVKIRDKQLQTLQIQIDELTKRDQEEKVRRIKLQTLQNPEIITDKFQNISKLLVYEGVMSYSDVIKESSWYGSKSLTIELKYNYGIGYDLGNVVVKNIFNDNGNIVVINIPKDQLKIEYVELDKESKLDSNKKWFNSGYTANDIEIILEQSQEKTRQKIENNKEIYFNAYDNLQETIKEIVKKLGFKDVVFNVI